jgi:predicted Zn-dependent protease
MAEYYRLFGDLSRAISHLEAALRSPIQDYYQEARLQAQLKDLRDQNADDKGKNQDKK